MHHSLHFWSFILLFLRLDFLVFLPFSLHICKRPKRQEALKISLWLKHFSVSPFSFFFFFLISYAATSIMLSSAGLSRIINSLSLKSIGKGVDYQSKRQLNKTKKALKIYDFYHSNWIILYHVKIKLLFLELEWNWKIGVNLTTKYDFWEKRKEIKSIEKRESCEARHNVVLVKLERNVWSISRDV